MRVENSAGTGQPDLNGCWHGIEVWVELKIFKGNQLIFRSTQPEWIRRRIGAGGRVFVLARKDDTLYLYDGLSAGNRSAETWLNVLPLFCTSIPFDYDGLLKKIFEKRKS